MRGRWVEGLNDDVWQPDDEEEERECISCGQWFPGEWLDERGFCADCLEDLRQVQEWLTK
jgi:hypothetical protein